MTGRGKGRPRRGVLLFLALLMLASGAIRVGLGVTEATAIQR